MLSHRQIIELWPSRADFARELSVGYQTARQWYARDGIPVRHWQAVVLAAKDRGFDDVTLEALVAGKAEGNSSEDASPQGASASESPSSPDDLVTPADDPEDDDGVVVCQGELKLQAAE